MNDASEVKLHFLDYWRIIKARAGLIVLAFLLVMVTAGVTTYFLPRQFYSKVTMEVKPDKSGPVTVFENSARAAYDATFIPTQFQILRKTEILYPVIEQLKLVDTWSAMGGKKLPRETIFLRLLGMLDPREVRNTGLIEIGVYSIDPQEAANIANTIAVVYKEKRIGDLQKAIDRGLSQVREELEKQRTIVTDLYAQMSLIRETDGIIDPDPESFQSNVSPADRDVMAIEKDVHEQRLIVTKLEGAIEAIMKLKPADLREAMRTLNIEDLTIIKMISQLQDATTKEAEMYSGGLAENHPRLNSERSKKEVFLQILSEQLTSVRTTQALLLDIHKRTLKDLEDRLVTSKNLSIEDKKRVTNYVDSKSRYLQAKRLFEAAEVKYSTERFNRGIDFDPAKIWEKAEPSLYPAKPNVPAYMALAAVIGLVVGVGLAFFIEYLDTSVKTLDDVEKYLQVPVLAVIPSNVSILIKTNADTPDAEAYRILRTNVEFNKPNRNANTFTLVSGGPGEGKSTTLNNLAFTCAQGGYNVLVVDADLRRPTQHTFFDQENSVGLVDYLVGRADLDEIVTTTQHDNLSFIASGVLPSESVGILNSQRMVELIAKVKGQYDLVFFDSPPILGVSDGAVLASECDVTIMVVQHRRFPRAMLLRVKQAVANAGGQLIGVVLNNVDSRHDEGYAYYNNYQDYYATPRTEKKKPLIAAAPRRPAAAPAPAGAPSPNGPPRPQVVDHEDY